LLKLGVDQEELAERLASQFGAERRSRPHVYEETMDTLRHLQGKYKLLLLTNGCPALQQEKLDGVPELSPFFDEIIISGSFGKGKPDPSIFDHALSKLGVKAEESIMVGDKLTTDIRGALSSGIRAVWINRENKINNETYSPDHEIKHLSDLEDIIANF
jgi:putative hydrolase of the HAD superfamily